MTQRYQVEAQDLVGLLLGLAQPTDTFELEIQLSVCGVYRAFEHVAVGGLRDHPLEDEVSLVSAHRFVPEKLLHGTVLVQRFFCDLGNFLVVTFPGGYDVRRYVLPDRVDGRAIVAVDAQVKNPKLHRLRGPEGDKPAGSGRRVVVR